MTITCYTLVHEGIKSRLISGNECYISVKKLLFSHLLPKSIKIKIYITIILPVVLYLCENWSLIFNGRPQTEGV
jgi:hypothetical protein